MKKGIHPEYFENAKVSCACGEEFETGSTKKEISLEMASHTARPAVNVMKDALSGGVSGASRREA